MATHFDFKALDAAVDAAARELDGGQLAIAHEGRLVFERAFGVAAPDTRFWVASATKPFVSAAACLLIDEGKLDLERPVAEIIPEFASKGKGAVTVEQVFLMTCGFPRAPMRNDEGSDPGARRARFSEWTLDWEPGTRWEYHPTSAHWVIADLIERLSGQAFTDFVESRLTAPLGLPRLLGIPREEQAALVQPVRQTVADDVPILDAHVLDLPAIIEAGQPGGGMFASAAHIALLHHTLLDDPRGLWQPATLRDATRNVRCTLPDPMMGAPANRTLTGTVGAGFGSAWGSSETAFGWAGLGGHIGFAEPATGISFGFVQTGGDEDQVSLFVRGMKLAKRALELGR